MILLQGNRYIIRSECVSSFHYLWYHDFICDLDRGFIVVRRLLIVRIDRLQVTGIDISCTQIIVKHFLPMPAAFICNSKISHQHFHDRVVSGLFQFCSFSEKGNIFLMFSWLSRIDLFYCIEKKKRLLPNIACVLSFSHSIINRLRTWRSEVVKMRTIASRENLFVILKPVLGIWRDTKVATAQSPTGLFNLQL